MNILGRLPVVTGWSLVAILVASCAGIELTTPSPTLPPMPSSTIPLASPTPSPSPSPTPVPPSPTAVPTPIPTPSEPPLSAEEVITRLITFSVSDVTFALVMDGTIAGTVGGQDTSASLEVSGDGSGQDFVGATSLSGPGLTLSFEMVVIGDRLWVQPTGGDWIQGPRDETQPIQPLFELGPEDVTYGGVTDANGELRHRLTINRWTGGDLSSNGYRRVRISIINYEVFVNNDGYPMEIDLDYRVRARVGRLPLDADYFLHYVLSDFGKAVTIEAPI